MCPCRNDTGAITATLGGLFGGPTPYNSSIAPGLISSAPSYAPGSGGTYTWLTDFTSADFANGFASAINNRMYDVIRSIKTVNGLQNATLTVSGQSAIYPGVPVPATAPTAPVGRQNGPAIFSCSAPTNPVPGFVYVQLRVLCDAVISD